MRGRPRAAPAETAPRKWKDKDGRWNAKVTVSRRLDGERERLRITRTTKRELDAAVRDIENARDAGQQPWLLENITVEQWLSFWLESILPLSVRWKTLSGYASLMRVHVIPNIGPLPLTEVRPETLERLYRKLLDEGSSTPLVHAVHRTFRSSLSEAVRRERLASNAAARARPPRVETVEIQPLSAGECQDILRASRATANPARWSVALALGLRQGEALGLTWRDVDLDEGVLRVRRSVQRRTWNHGCTIGRNRAISTATASQSGASVEGSNTGWKNSAPR
jgi:integrase